MPDPNESSLPPILINAENIPTVNTGSEPAAKQFAVNATGNLFIASTLNNATGNGLTKEAQEAFSQVSVFFAAMTKAMNESGKNLYDFDALGNLIKGSGLFINVTKSDIDFKSSSFGVTFGSELIQALLGLSGDLSSIAKSLSSLVTEVGRQGFNMTIDKENQVSKVGTIVFVCEYLLGAISISPMAIYADLEANSSNFKVGPCFKTQSKLMTWNFSKEVFLFVPPSFMSQAATMNKAVADPAFNEMVERMIGNIKAGTEG